MAPRFLIATFILQVVCLAGAADVTEWRGTSEVKFLGTSTLHGWSGTVPVEPFVAQVTMNDQGKPTAIKAKVAVKVSKMDTKQADRDEKMRACMKMDSFPLVTGHMDVPFENVMRQGEAEPAHLPFRLELLGKPHDVNAAINHWKHEGGKATFDLDFELSLKRCGISVPSVLGVIRVGDAIKLHAVVNLVRA